MLVTESFTGTGVGTNTGQPKTAADKNLSSRFNLDISGTFVGTVELQRSFDGGSSFQVVDGETHTAPVSKVLEEPEAGVLYRFECTAYTSGTIVCRASND